MLPASEAGDAAPPPSTSPARGDPPGPADPPGPPNSAGPPSPSSLPRPPSPPAPGRGEPPDPVLAAERDHLRRSREFLRLMREDVLGLEAMAGDRVSQEYLKADLYHRAQALRDIPDVPLFFGRLDYAEGAVMDPGTFPAGGGQPEEEAGGDGGSGGAGRPGRALPGERLHIGRRHIHDRLARAGVPALLPGQRGRPDGPGAAAPVRLRRRRAHRL